MADKITTVLWFDHVGEEAANFYCSLGLPDSHVDRVIRSPGDNPSGKEGDVLVIDFTLDGRKYSALNGGDMFKPNESVSFMIVTEDQAETDRLWNAITGNGGQESVCGWCKDKWGYSWQITPRVLLESMTNPDRDAARRAHEAMMKMKKIDVAAIEAAIAG
ncbi:MAG: VOC family protein [Sphingomonas sp.]|uniref:VOC family protein n=1 Tax=Sphingomonas sp. TaxID=28214 RepID=UPI0025FD32A0|nr:VOC family protein [Sphingomonas sp.]MBX3563489.1 VOC family protein [Sphingomonas sp.]